MTRKLWVLQRIAALWWCSVCRHTLRCRSNNNDNSLFGLDKLLGICVCASTFGRKLLRTRILVPYNLIIYTCRMQEYLYYITQL